MCKNSLFIPQSVKSKHSFLICFEIAKELSEFRNYLYHIKGKCLEIIKNYIYLFNYLFISS